MTTDAVNLGQAFQLAGKTMTQKLENAGACVRRWEGQHPGTLAAVYVAESTAAAWRFALAKRLDVLVYVDPRINRAHQDWVFIREECM